MTRINNLFLIGLPGCGKTQVVTQLDALKPLGTFELSDLIVRESIGFDFAARPEEQACLVWDARENFEAYETVWLNAFFAQSDRLMITHWTQLDLMLQSQFSRQLKTWFDGAVFYADTLVSHKLSSLLAPVSTPKPMFSPIEQDVVTINFSIGRVVLDHLLFVLDMVQQNHQRPIWRAQGMLSTQEYVNPVMLDMTRSQLRTYGASVASHKQDDVTMRQLMFWMNPAFDQVQLRDWLAATLAPGERIGI